MKYKAPKAIAKAPLSLRSPEPIWKLPLPSADAWKSSKEMVPPLSASLLRALSALFNTASWFWGDGRDDAQLSLVHPEFAFLLLLAFEGQLLAGPAKVLEDFQVLLILGPDLAEAV